MKFNLVFKRGHQIVAEVKGFRDVGSSELDFSKVIETEQFLEQLTGLRVHVEEEQEQEINYHA